MEIGCIITKKEKKQRMSEKRINERKIEGESERNKE